ncbi:hypothetical protein KEJ39_00825 [Candidatus Bathyarchaeota archaeon]|nr:hypothetical protein [Candidatus Bathyarchaeota archaeon]
MVRLACPPYRESTRIKVSVHQKNIDRRVNRPDAKQDEKGRGDDTVLVVDASGIPEFTNVNMTVADAG